MGATRLEAAEKTDAGRVAPISACVFLQLSLIQPALIKTETSDNNYHI